VLCGDSSFEDKIDQTDNSIADVAEDDGVVAEEDLSEISLDVQQQLIEILENRKKSR
jgi:uncharacterized protein YecA (UPF0149 family)